MDETRARDFGAEIQDTNDNPRATDRNTEVRGKAAALPPKANSMQLKKGRSSQSVNSTGLTSHDSNTFKLQIEEMLRKVQPSYEKRMARINATLQTLKQIIENLPDQGPLPVFEAEERLLIEHGVRVPFPEPQPAKDVKYTFSYAKPTNINIVGSFVRQTAIKANDQLSIDFVVTMPSKIFQENDYLNYRYCYKRAYYLARIAAGIRDFQDAPYRVDYTLQNDNHLQPIIVITPNPSDRLSDFAQSKCQVRILLAADGNLFPTAKTTPAKACLRLPSTSQNARNKPTPFYNATIRSECCSLHYLEFLHRASCDSQGFKDACILGSIWLRQRGFGAGLTCGGFGPFEWACTVASLMQGGGLRDKPRLSKKYDSIQTFKATLEYLSIESMVETPTFIDPETTEIHENDVPMFYDNASGLNLLFKMTPWSYDLLRHEATRTLNLLNDPYADHLEACFITKVDDNIRRFDCLATFTACQFPATKLLLPIFDAYDSGIQATFLAHQVLKRAVGDRANLLFLQNITPSSWAITTVKSPPPQRERILIGILLNPQHINRTVDRGPSADEKEMTDEFRKFWGGKAELRRFNDGSIRESLIWSFPSDKSVLEQILAFTLKRSLGSEAADSLTMLTDIFKKTTFGMLPDVAAVRQPMMAAYEVLEKQIRAMEDMPLQIRHICLADAQLHNNSQTFYVEDAPSSQSTEPVNVLIQFGGSSRWPDDLAAVQRTKIALLLKIGELLEGSAPASSILTRLGLEGQTIDFSKNLTNIAFLDVIYSSGALFRLKIHHERELSLLQHALENATSETGKELASSALFAYKRDFVQSPLHAQAIHTLSTRYPVLLPSIYLMKNWRDAQLLSDHICDELIELLTIHSFTQPHPWAVPGSAVTGFLRTLAFISRWDWRFDPLVIDFTGEMQVAEYDATITRFAAWRKIDPAMNRLAMFVASNHDPEGVSWTGIGPSKVVAARLTSLAKSACTLMSEQGIGLEAAALFTVSLEDYDFVLHINPKFAREDAVKRREKKQKFKNMQIKYQQYQDVLPTLTVRSYLDELRTLYGSNALFFYNQKEGSIVGGLWNPQTRPRSWKVNVGYPTVAVKGLSQDGGQIVPNNAGILHNIAELGGDLILKIEERK